MTRRIQDPLPEDLRDALLGEVADRRPDASVERALRARLLERVRRERAREPITIRGGDAGWEPFGPKLHIKMLHRDGAHRSFLLRLEPGAVIDAHDHEEDEECLVLEGEIRSGDLVVRAGDYHLAPRGVRHEPIHSPAGALLFIRAVMPAGARLP
jgi:quercetin dioxygenase-like cupin family protein